MKIGSRLLSASLFSAACTSALYADTFNFSFSGSNDVSGPPGIPFSGAGQITATEVGSTSTYTVTAVTGTTAGQNILILVPAFSFNDNLLFYTAGSAFATFDTHGIQYALAGGQVFLFQNTSSQNQEQLFEGNEQLPIFFAENQVSPITITPVSASPIPEPGSLALLGTGTLGALGVLRRRLAL